MISSQYPVFSTRVIFVIYATVKNTVAWRTPNVYEIKISLEWERNIYVLSSATGNSAAYFFLRPQT